MRASMAAGVLTLTAFFLVVSRPAHADPQLQSFLEGALRWLQNRDHDPAIAALIQIDGQVAAEAAVGHRALGLDESVTLNDRWHIGSDTKAFTATLVGTLVDQHVMAFDDTLEVSLPALAKTMHPAYRHITVRQLLSHTAGLPPLKNTETEFPAAVSAVKSVQGVSAQRAALARVDRRPGDKSRRPLKAPEPRRVLTRCIGRFPTLVRR